MLDNLFTPTHFLILLLPVAFWILILYIAWRSFRALLNIERSIADIANTLRDQQTR